MRKNITKEQILNTALDLIKDKNDIKSVNLREIARSIGCAHTNIYNYFPSFDDLLWELHSTIQKNFIKTLHNRLLYVKNYNTNETLEYQNHDIKLECFFQTFIDFYTDNPGWFRLNWIEYIKGTRPDNNKLVHKQTIDSLIDTLISIWDESYNITPTRENTYSILHNTHCYIIGEISNYLNGRAIIDDINSLKKYILRESTAMFTLILKERS